MKTLGLLGGMSWESTLPYYRLINQGVSAGLGGLHSASLVLYSVDFADIARLQAEGDWQRAGDILAARAVALQKAGAEAIVLCTNTMHKVAETIEWACPLPFLHIADATAREINLRGMRRVGLLGTRFTMQQDFYRRRFEYPHGIEILVPTAAEMDEIHRVIFEELCLGKIRNESRQAYRRIIAALELRGIEGLILGCTEIGLLIGEGDATVPLFDTTAIHAAAAVAFALG
ncbi:aspartate/glutamate racemase family protein [Acerihabitans arboris]|uniref:Amino acid racemase n=1 Tax=Acerihabitans arboris TaxID=2691583 RepID=A0A845SS49_9GAMM|nr:aspartate/glutamate racemase family protein [Acerihabitans arboris]NDL65917.1 amino acid racemase [Acerihabitans arboris]